MKRGFGDLEAVIMETLWRRGSGATVREVLDDLRGQRENAYTTVMTVMDNLHRKGWLDREMDGRAYRYTPVSTREQYSAQLMREALSASDDRTAALAHFVAQMDPAESAALRAALARLEEETAP